MKRILFLASVLLMSLGIYAQEVTTLTFTAKQQNNAYQQLDSVVVTNLTKEWTEVIYYPDTLLLMNTVGITDWENTKGNVKLYQNIPNPFHGITDFNLTLGNKEKVELVIFDINGKKVAEYRNTLPSGEHMFRATMNTPQTYLLSAVTKNGNTSIKMINLSNTGEQARIEYVGSKALIGDVTKKQSQNPFSKGDNMQYVGYATQNDGSHDNTITQTQQGSETITFTFPTETQDPIVQAFTDAATEVTLNSATLNGHYNVLYTEVTELGFEYKKADETEFTPVYVTNQNSPFSYNLKALADGTEYVFKAFVKADSTVAYGEEQRFTTEKVKETKVITGDATDINKRGATLHGSYELGNEEIAAIGFDYKVEGETEWKQAMVAVKATPFEAKIENEFEPSTKVIYRAFALKSDFNPINGEEKSFTTEEVSPEMPEVTTVKAETGAYNDMGAMLKGTLVSEGYCEMKERGFLWGKDENPKDKGTKVPVELGTDKNFSFETGTLEPGTTYYYVAYATNVQGTAYGEVMSFKTRDARDLAVLTINNVEAFSTSANITSEVVSSGETLTERGICYSTKGEPTVADTKMVDAGTGVGVFTSALSDLTEGTEYKVRAYAISWAGTAYSDTKTFTTPKLTKPEVTTDSIIKIGGGSATVASTLTVQGGTPDIVVGVVVSKDNAEPTVEKDSFYEGTLSDLVFMTKVSKLEKETHYYARAYASNEAGEAYGKVLEFTTTAGFVCGDDIEDVDGNSYKTAEINHLCWMAENLRVKTYSDGTKLEEWTPALRGDYKNHSIYAEVTHETIGTEVFYLYNTATRMLSNTDQEKLIQGICPDGWHIPSWVEYAAMFESLDPTWQRGTSSYLTSPAQKGYGNTANSNNKLGVQLASPKGHWTAYKHNDVQGGGLGDEEPTATTTVNSIGYVWKNNPDDSLWNKSGFSAMPAGYISKNSNYGQDAAANWYNNGTLNLLTSISNGTYPSIIKIACYNTGTPLFTYSSEMLSGYSVRCAKDPDPELPTVTTNEVEQVTSTTAALSGNIDFNGRSAITERGFYYGTMENVAEEGTKVVSEDKTTAFATLLTELEPSTTYNFVAYAINEVGTGYGKVLSFTTNKPAVLAQLKVNEARNLLATSVDMVCEVVDDGGEVVTERGICWATTENPEIDSAAQNFIADAATGEGEYTISFDSLVSGQTYHFRAYANTLKGLAYSEDFALTMPTAVLPTIKVDSIFKVTAKAAQAAVTIESNGYLVVTASGVVYDTIQNPELGGDAFNIESNATEGSFTSSLKYLRPDHTYYVRAYAINALGTSYSEQVSFKTDTAGSASTTDCGTVVDVDGNEYETVIIGHDCWMKEDLRVKHTPTGEPLVLKTAVPSNYGAYGGKAYYEGSSEEYPELGTVILYSWYAAMNATERKVAEEPCQGICPDGWHVSTHAEWTEIERLAGMSEADIAKVYLNNWSRNFDRGEVARAFCAEGAWPETDEAASNELAPGYSADDSPVALNSLGFSAVPTAVVYGKGMEQFGVRNSWWTSTLYKGFVTCHEIMTKFACVDYYYVDRETSNNLCSNTGRSIRCVKDPEPEEPAVRTDSCETVTASTAILSGEVTFDGRLDIIEKGFYYNTTENVKAGEKVVVEGEDVAFTTTLTDLPSKTTYYFAAFAKNMMGEVLGEVKTFTTLDAAVPATVKITNHENLKAGSVTVNCEVVEDGGEPVTERGICWSTTANPDIEAGSSLQSKTVGVGEYTMDIDGLTPNTEYHFRAYATTLKGVAYSEDYPVTTPDGKYPEVTTDSLNNVTSSGATIYGTITSNGNLDITECGVVVDTVANSAEAKVFKAKSIADNFEVSVTGLKASTTYYVRAYAKNEVGAAYGEELTFTTDSGFSCGSKIQDIDGNTYNTVQIGEQCWMKEDLRTKTMPNGKPINSVAEGSQPSNYNVGNYYYYEREDEYVGHSVYYPWSTASNVSNNSDQKAKIQGICPDGWYLPTYRDYAILCNYVDPEFNIEKTYSANTNIPSNNKLGIKLALPQGTGEDYGHWLHYKGPGYVDANQPGGSGPNPEYATAANTPGYNYPEYKDDDFNASKFCAKPKGYKDRKDNQFHFNGALNLWTSISTGVSGSAVAVKVAMNVTGITSCTYSNVANDFYSVRCIKGEDPVTPDDPEEPEGTTCRAHIIIDGGGWSKEVSATLLVDGKEVFVCYGEEPFDQEVEGEKFQIVVKQSAVALENKPLTEENHFIIEMESCAFDSNEYLEKMNESFRFAPQISIKCGDKEPTIE